MRSTLALFAILTLAACSQPSAPAGEGGNQGAKTPSPQANTPPTGGAPAADNRIPQAFQGVWDGLQGHCDPDSDLRVEFAASQLSFYESSGQVKAVKQDGPGTIEVTLAMAGEGEQWTQTMRFALSPDGRQMIASPVPADKSGLTNTLKRCPK